MAEGFEHGLRPRPSSSHKLAGSGLRPESVVKPLKAHPNRPSLMQAPVLVPVSYTHLDVYKRQSKSCGAFQKCAETKRDHHALNAHVG